MGVAQALECSLKVVELAAADLLLGVQLAATSVPLSLQPCGCEYSLKDAIHSPECSSLPSCAWCGTPSTAESHRWRAPDKLSRPSLGEFLLSQFLPARPQGRLWARCVA